MSRKFYLAKGSDHILCEDFIENSVYAWISFDTDRKHWSWCDVTTDPYYTKVPNWREQHEEISLDEVEKRTETKGPPDYIDRHLDRDIW